MSAFLRDQPIPIIKHNKGLVRRLIKKVKVYEDKFTEEFKSNVMVDVKEYT